MRDAAKESADLQGAENENLAVTLHYLTSEPQADYLEVSFVKQDPMFPGSEERVIVERLSGNVKEKTWIFSDDGQVIRMPTG